MTTATNQHPAHVALQAAGYQLVRQRRTRGGRTETIYSHPAPMGIETWRGRNGIPMRKYLTPSVVADPLRAIAESLHLRPIYGENTYAGRDGYFKLRPVKDNGHELVAEQG